MAKPIKQIERQTMSEEEEKKEALNQILELTAESKEAVTTFLEIIQELHEAGVLEMVRGFLKTRDKVGVLAIEQLNQPGVHRIIKNGINTVQFLSQLDPDQMKIMLNGVSKGLAKTGEGNKNEQTGIWSMMRSMRDPDVKASISTMVNFLEGMGKEINKSPVH